MATTSRTGMTILGLAAATVLGVGGTVLAAGGAHHDDPNDRGLMMGGSMMGDPDQWADHDRMMGDPDQWADHDRMMGDPDQWAGHDRMMGDPDQWAGHDRMMAPSDMAAFASAMPDGMWEQMWEHMGVTASDADPEGDAVAEPANGASTDDQETPAPVDQPEATA